ncbi:uncharacterized protein LOC134569373 [Pelobates fuscus]|uniref:uncharacterized protein LOC134569373 n=1 Tax=Pelobates fuscus TaxID=191477 RepID=UPI002FE44B28
MDISPVSVKTSSSVTIIEKECFICREGDQEDQEELQHFCDCKGLIVHHQCLLTWIQKGSGNEDRQKCNVCTAKYLLQDESVWKILVCRWKSLLLFVLLTAAIILVPFFVYQMKTLSHPPPDVLFLAAVICSGTIAETLLIKYIIWYCISQYNEAKMSSYSIKPKTINQHGDRGLQCPAGQTSTAVVNMTEQENQNGVLQSGTNYMKLSV